jgi:hypothetical protein
MVLMVLTQAITHANKDYLTLTYPLNQYSIGITILIAMGTRFVDTTIG